MKIRFGEFKTDCDSCDALCCVELSILNTNDLGLSKPAGKPCEHLGEAKECTIYGKRSKQGLSVCGKYDCLGAGPLTTQLFSGLKIDIENSLLDKEAKKKLLEKWRIIRGQTFQGVQQAFFARKKRGEQASPEGDVKTLENLIEDGIDKFVTEIRASGVRLVCSASEFK